MGCKFLTSSHLFLLQLQDPLLRQQIAVQILYLVHFLKVKQLPQYLEASIVQLGVNKDNMVTDMLDDLVKLHDRIYELLKATPPNNIEIVNILKRLMYRENYWISWKANGCQAFEKVSSSSKYGSIETYEDNKRRFSDYLYVGKKQKRSRSIASLPKLGEEYAFDNTEENVKDAARNLVQAQPSFARQIEVLFIFMQFCSLIVNVVICCFHSLTRKQKIQRLELKRNIIPNMTSKCNFESFKLPELCQ